MNAKEAKDLAKKAQARIKKEQPAQIKKDYEQIIKLIQWACNNGETELVRVSEIKLQTIRRLRRDGYSVVKVKDDMVAKFPSIFGDPGYKISWT
jgi:hypothetical protein